MCAAIAASSMTVTLFTVRVGGAGFFATLPAVFVVVLPPFLSFDRAGIGEGDNDDVAFGVFIVEGAGLGVAVAALALATAAAASVETMGRTLSWEL